MAEDRRFDAVRAVREAGWHDPGPTKTEPFDVTFLQPVAQAPTDHCPKPRPCCTNMAAQLEEEHGIFQLLCNVPFFANRSTPPTIYACSDGGHGGMVEILFCPFCGTLFAWRSNDGSPA